jgi:hypothetical protein
LTLGSRLNAQMEMLQRTIFSVLSESVLGSGNGYFEQFEIEKNKAIISFR